MGKYINKQTVWDFQFPQDDLPPAARTSGGDTTIALCSVIRAAMKPRCPQKLTGVLIPSVPPPTTPQL